MKDSIITARRKKTELIWLGISFILACIFNIAAIIKFKSPATELITSFFYVLCASVVLYVMLAVIRLIILGFIRLFKKD